MEQFGKILIIFGLVMAVVGAILLFSNRISWLGRLPGDIMIQKKNFTFYFPLATSILVSLVLSLLFWLFRKWQ